MKKFCFSLLLVFPILVFGQLRNADVYKLPEMGKENIRENINIPGFDGYEVLKCDFHIHTVFSDGIGQIMKCKIVFFFKMQSY